MVAPGWVDTPGERIIQAALRTSRFSRRACTTSPLPKMSATAVVFLASPAGRKVNGVTIYLDFGLHVADDAGMVYLPADDRIRYHKP